MTKTVTGLIAFPKGSRVNMTDAFGGRYAATVVQTYADLPDYRGLKFDDRPKGRGIACPVSFLEMRNS